MPGTPKTADIDRDARLDKKQGVKPGSKRDEALDKKRGVGKGQGQMVIDDPARLKQQPTQPATWQQPSYPRPPAGGRAPQSSWQQPAQPYQQPYRQQPSGWQQPSQSYQPPAQYRWQQPSRPYQTPASPTMRGGGSQQPTQQYSLEGRRQAQVQRPSMGMGGGDRRVGKGQGPPMGGPPMPPPPPPGGPMPAGPMPPRNAPRPAMGPPPGPPPPPRPLPPGVRPPRPRPAARPMGGSPPPGPPPPGVTGVGGGSGKKKTPHVKGGQRDPAGNARTPTAGKAKAKRK